MKQIPSDKYNVAWFTLAECVSRGEKVRAMSLYRLLAHSIEDLAFTAQLKGDLLLAFEDKTASVLYEEAAELYLKEDRLLEAIGVFEHLHILDSKKYRYIKSLVKLYQKLGIQSKVNVFLKRLLEALFIDGKDASLLIGNIEKVDPKKDVIRELGNNVIEQLAEKGDDKALKQFLTSVEKQDSELYHALSDYLENIRSNSK